MGNLIIGWTNASGSDGYGTLTTSGLAITSAVSDDSAQLCYSNAITMVGQRSITVSFTLTLNGGLVPSVWLAKSTALYAPISNTEDAVEGVNEITLIADYSETLVLCFYNANSGADWSTGDIVALRNVESFSLVANSSGTFYTEIGYGAGMSGTFGLRYYITKTGARMIDWMQGLGIGWISLMGDEIWKHNSDNVSRCNFFGEQKNMVVGLVFNKDAGVIKILDSMEIHSDGEWVVDSIEIPATLNYPDGMYSKIPQGKFRNREGVLYAEFLRNMKSKSGTISAIQALKGEPLRGDAAYMVLRNTSTDEVSLFKVRINATTSR